MEKLKKLVARMYHIIHQESLSSLDREILLSGVKSMYDMIMDLEVEANSIDVLEKYEITATVDDELFAQNLDKEAEQLYRRASQLAAMASKAVELSREKLNEVVEDNLLDTEHAVDNTYVAPPSIPDAELTIASEARERPAEESIMSEEEVLEETYQESQSDTSREEDYSGADEVSEHADAMVGVDQVAEMNAELEELFSFPSSNELSSKLAAQPIDDLRKAISINDRLLFSKVLFGGEDDEYEKAVHRLNEYDNKIDAEHLLKPLALKYEWSSPHKQGIAKTFIRTVKRKFV